MTRTVRQVLALDCGEVFVDRCWRDQADNYIFGLCISDDDLEQLMVSCPAIRDNLWRVTTINIIHQVMHNKIPFSMMDHMDMRAAFG